LNTPAAITDTPARRQAGSIVAAADRSSSVYRPASRTASTSVSVAKRSSMRAWFMPAPMAPTTP